MQLILNLYFTFTQLTLTIRLLLKDGHFVGLNCSYSMKESALMTKDNLKMLDTDEIMREIMTENLHDLIQVAKKYDLIINIASSDVTIFITDVYGNEIELGGA